MSTLHKINGRRLHVASAVILLAGLVVSLLVFVAAALEVDPDIVGYHSIDGGTLSFTLEDSSRTAWSPNLARDSAKVDRTDLCKSIHVPGHGRRWPRTLAEIKADAGRPSIAVRAISRDAFLRCRIDLIACSRQPFIQSVFTS